MGFVPFNNTIKLEAIFTQDGQRIENVHHFQVDETPDVATCTALAQVYSVWWSDNLQPLVSSTVALTMIRCTILETESSPGVEFTGGLPKSGQGAAAALPMNVTVAVRWVTGLRGRSYRGRTYHIGLPEEHVTMNQVSTAHLTALKAAYEDLMALSIPVGPAVLGVASRVHNGVERPQGVITSAISVFIDPTIDSQRRRLPGRGR
jgi:hypothetical protein